MPDNYVNFTTLSAGGAKDCYYTIKFKAQLPQNHRVFLCVGRRNNFCDITNGYDRRSLFGLAQCFKEINRWTEKVDCFLEGGIAPNAVGNIQSNVLPLTLPVKPLKGQLTTASIANDPLAFTYTGTGVGRFFDFEKLDGESWYFKYGGNLETDPKMRGLDCTTFPRALFELDCNVAGSVPGNNSAALNIAAALGATGIEIENKSRTEMFDKLFGMSDKKEFIRWPREGLYLLWTMGHIMLYKGDKTSARYGIHEFTGTGDKHSQWGAEGYKETSIINRTFYGGPYWARKIPKTWESRVINTYKSDMFTSDFPTPMGSDKPYSIGAQGPVSSIGVSKSPTNGGTNGGTTGGTPYKVSPGDSLSLITSRFWSDALLWPLLYDANKKVVGSDPNKIYPGQQLTVPSIKNYSQSQLDDARSRGRNWH